MRKCISGIEWIPFRNSRIIMPKYDVAIRLYEQLLGMYPGDIAHRYPELAMAAFTGARISELGRLQLRDLGADWNSVSEVPAGNVRIISSKRKDHVRFVPVPRVLLEAMRIYVIRHAITSPDTRIFNVSLVTLTHKIEKQSEELLGVCLPPHAVRHAFAIYMLAVKKVDITRLAYWLGHTDTYTTLQIYGRYIPPPKESPW